MKNLKDQIARLGALADGWKDGSVDPLERDLALEILRGIYGQLRFPETDQATDTIPETESRPGNAGCAGPEPEPVPVITEEALAEPVAEAAEEVAVATVEETQAEAEVEPETKTETASEPAAIAEPEVIPDPQPETGAEPAPIPQPEPAAAEKPAIGRRVPADVIRSLYGDGQAAPPAPERREPNSEEPEQPAPQSAPEPTQETNPEPAATDEPQQETEVTPEPPVETEPEPAPIPQPEPAEPKTVREPAVVRTTLGDAMGGGRQTLGESLGNGKKDMASKIAAADTSTLRASIGLNDRFLMIRDMFGGDAMAFDKAIAVLDGFADLDEAIIYIHDTYDWSADSEGVKLLVELLERKLG